MDTQRDDAPVGVLRCTYREVRHLRGPAARERVSVQDSADTQWFAAVVGGVVAGCGGVLTRSGSIFRLKGQFVLPQHRRRGLGTALLDAQVGYAVESMASMVEVYAHAPRTYERLGFSPTGRTLPNGAVHMVRTL